MIVHEESYKGRGLVSHIHRRRLDLLFEILERLERLKTGVVADFGCSNGYILSLIQARECFGRAVEYHGFDHSEELLALAREQNGDAATYHPIDLNRENSGWEDHFDRIHCLETLEHTADYGAALANLYRTCKPGGLIVISVPNEKGVPGLLKFLPLRVLRKQGHLDFFQGKSELEYVKCLALGRRIDGFRQPPRSWGWGSHLGFDWQVFVDFIEQEYVRAGKMSWVERTSNFIGFNLFYVLRKAL